MTNFLSFDNPEVRKSRHSMMHQAPEVLSSSFFDQCVKVRCILWFNSASIILVRIVLLISPVFTFSQTTIRGSVQGAGGLPLENATVYNLTQNTGITTAPDGNFSISGTSGDTLEISFIGYLPQSIIIQDAASPITVSLLENAIDLDQVVVLGYTSQKVKETTGSISIVKTKDLTAIPAGQVGQMLQGRVAGLNVISSGEPGTPINIYMHGLGNFGDVTPLYIIDGVQGDINSLNPNDIESLQVLKDAGAYSIYGVRGANGVIVITTKQGREGRAKLDYSTYLSYTQPLRKGFDLLSPRENAELLWIALKNAGQVDANGNPSHPLYGNGPEPVLPDYISAGPHIGLMEGDPRADISLYNIDPSTGPVYQIVPFNKSGTDWFHELFKPAWSQNHSLTISGGASKNKYLASFGYLDQQGTYLNTYLKRYTARVNTEFTLQKKIRIGENLQLAYSQNPRANNLFYGEGGGGIFTNPYLPIYDVAGNWSHPGGLSNNPPGPNGNPVADRTLSKDNRAHNWQIFGNAFAEIDFLPNLTLRSSFGGTLNFDYGYSYGFGTYEPPPQGINSSFFEFSEYRVSSTWTNTLIYDRKLADGQQLKILLGAEQKENNGRFVNGSRLGYFVDDPDFRFLSNGSPNNQVNNSGGFRSYLQSFFGQVDYGYRDKYFINLILRRDASSLFGPDNRVGWFPSVGVAWRLTQENIFSGSDWLSDLKVRASWGKTGFDGNTDPNNQFTLYGTGVLSSFYDINGTSNSAQQGFRQVRVGNASTGWQEDVVSNLGLEAIFWNRRLSLTADYYIKKSEGLLFGASLPAILGDFQTPNINVGSIRNKGLDISLGSIGRLANHLSWDVLATFGSYRNEIIKINDLPFFDMWEIRGVYLSRNEVGHSIGSFYGYRVVGIFQNEEDVAEAPMQPAAAPGRFQYADVNGRDAQGNLTGQPDGKITPDDRVHIGNPNPDFTLGLNVGLTYKNFDFSTFFYGTFGNDILNQVRNSIDIFRSELSLVPKSKAALYESWTPERPDAVIPIVENDQNFSNAGVVNSYRIEKGTYFRCKSIVFGYSFPNYLLQKLRSENLRLYVQATNVFTLSRYSGLDPELAGKYNGTSLPAYGIDGGNYPNNQLQLLIGLNLNF